MPIKVLRIFNTYGPRMQIDDGRVVSNYIRAALAGEPLEITGDGSQTRAFCFVTDMIDAMLALMATDDHVTGPINAGSTHETSVAELARIILELTQSNSALVYRDAVIDDPRQRCPDIALARSLLSWRPTTDLNEGLARTIDYFRSV